MDRQVARKPSLQERAAYLRRVQSRKRTVDVRRTPNTPLPPSMVNARDALEVAWSATMDVRPEEQARVADMMNKPSHQQNTRQIRDAEDGIARPYMCTYAREATRYGTHYRTRLTGQGRKVYVRNDAWARARSIEVGTERLWAIAQERRALYVRVDSVRGIGNGIEVRSWDELHNPEAMAVRRALRASTEHQKDLWVLRTIRDDTGVAVFDQHAETGEIRRPRA